MKKLAQRVGLPQCCKLLQPVLCQQERPTTHEPTIFLAMRIEVQRPPPAVAPPNDKQCRRRADHNEHSDAMMALLGMDAALLIATITAAIGAHTHQRAAEEAHGGLDGGGATLHALAANAVVVQLAEVGGQR